MWYSLREGSGEPITFQYVDENGRPQTQTIVMRDYAEHERLNPVVMGTDMEYLMQSPWMAGIIATIGPWFVDKDRVAAKYRPVVRGCTGELQDGWLERMEAYRKQYAAPGHTH